MPRRHLAYGQALRATGQRAQAAAVLEQATIAHPGNKTLLAAYGRALADNGNSQAAFDVLSRAHSPANPDWRILSVQGTTLDKMGKHEEARRYYATRAEDRAGRALGAVQSRPVLHADAGIAAGRGNAAARLFQSPRRRRVRQNLALVVGLQGRFAEAETIAKGDLPADEAAANVAYLREMLSRKDKDNSRPPAARRPSRSRPQPAGLSVAAVIIPQPVRTSSARDRADVSARYDSASAAGARNRRAAASAASELPQGSIKLRLAMRCEAWRAAPYGERRGVRRAVPHCIIWSLM